MRYDTHTHTYIYIYVVRRLKVNHVEMTGLTLPCRTFSLAICMGQSSYCEADSRFLFQNVPRTLWNLKNEMRNFDYRTSPLVQGGALPP